MRGDNVTTGYYGAPEATAAGVRGRLAAHRRHRRLRRAGPGVHPRPQEGDDRHARGAERLPRGRRARADRDRRRARRGGRRPHLGRRGARARGAGRSIRAIDADAVVRDANARLGDHQKIRSASVWPAGELPRTEGTRKLKRRRDQAVGRRRRARPTRSPSAGEARRASRRSSAASRTGARDIGPDTTIDELGLSSLERVELLMALEERFETTIDEAAVAAARTVGDLDALGRRRALRSAARDPASADRGGRATQAGPARAAHARAARRRRRRPGRLSALEPEPVRRGGCGA